MNYDSRIIHEVAERLYKDATVTEVLFTVIGVAIGAVVGRFVASSQDYQLMAMGGGGAVFGLIGYGIGRMRATSMRFSAQMALCQAQIEENTRPARAAGPNAGTVAARRSAGRISDALSG